MFQQLWQPQGQRRVFGNGESGTGPGESAAGDGNDGGKDDDDDGGGGGRPAGRPQLLAQLM